MTAPVTHKIDVSRDRDNPSVATVTLNNPEKRNAVSWPMWQQLLTDLHALEADPDIRIVIVTGAGGSFCSGADMSSQPPRMHPLTQMDSINNVVLALHRLSKITVAKVDGDAIGAGLNLALACDVMIASDRSRFSEIFVQRGLSIDFGGSWILPRLIGMHRAKELCLTGDIISADEAAEIGLASRVVPADEIDTATDSLVRRLLRGAPVAQFLTKRLLNEGLHSTLEQAVNHEAMAQVDNLGSSDSLEARNAFLERRPPQFTGRWPGRV
ncbi:enoyl-CoA hydratase/isomerase family protein [Rhodococcus globerulus]|uniref:Enoyl-CoA hydratase n=1 Tax=Rhodococcus globerulus TaxID=33008 RepID=A0ABU4C4C4_RHOGO|nr:enoyl-CoA hydratase [Rhodococcus globerulus]MDV6271149.1 enoyl-CoA hydratase [Rhodococcus globerulus]